MLISNLASLRGRRISTRTILLCACLIALFVWSLSPFHYLRIKHSRWPCRDLPDTDQSLLILRTGATEIDARLPTHFSTTFRCFPNRIIFSDYEESFRGEKVFDALEYVDHTIKAQHHDFELYRRLQEKGREGLSTKELAGSAATIPSDSGHTEIQGWKLDKWKFVPMVNRTLFEYPNMKWYVFIEADSFLLWSSMSAYLAQQDSKKPGYFGVDTYIGDCVFAHGGAGFVVSQPAMQMIVDHYNSHKSEVEGFTNGQWAGDCVLGKTFKDAGVSLTSVWPLVHGESTGHAYFARLGSPGVPREYKQLWCYPAATFHHMTPEASTMLWEFEQDFLRRRTSAAEVLRHHDIFKDHIMPQMWTTRMDWDNLNAAVVPDIDSIDACRTACQKESTCKQYSYDAAGVCKTRINPRLGIPTNGTKSGWMEKRVEAFFRDMTPCKDEGLGNLPGQV